MTSTGYTACAPGCRHLECHVARVAERDRQFTETVLMLYPGTTVDVVTANVGCFARHYAGAITTDELAARTGYRLPTGARRPHNPVIKINPATDLAATYRMSPEDAAEQAGCWLEGSRGWTANGELVNIADRHGMPLDDDDRAVVDAYLARADEITLSNGVALGSEKIREYVTDQCGLAEDAAKYLNEYVAPEGYAFGWHDGEFFLWTDEQWDEVL